MRNAIRSHGFWQGLIVALVPVVAWFLTGNITATLILAGMSATVLITGIMYQITVRRSVQKTLEMYRQTTGRSLSCRGVGLRYYLLCARRAIKEMARLISMQAKQQQQLRQGILSLKHPVMLVDAKQKIDMINGPARELLGAEQDTPLSQCQASAVELLDAVRQTRETKRPVVVEFQLLRPQKRWLRAEAVPVGERVLITLDDITSSKEIEQTKSRIVSSVSHQLRTPLTVIAGYLEMALDESVPEQERQNALSVAAKHTERLANIVDQLVDLSRMEEKKLRLRPTDVKQLIENATEIYQTKAKQKGVDFRMELGSGLQGLSVDPKALETIVVNLLDNAVKFTPSGGSVTLRARIEGDCLFIEVEDTGLGIAPQELQRIFERFYTGNHPEAGSGLGLAMVKWAAAAHGGDVKVESRVDKGSVFTVRIPMPRTGS